MSLPPGPYGVILADPPWAYRTFSEAKHGAAISAYPTMSTEDICALDVGSLAGPDCALLLWGTWPKLPDALKVIEAWGFEFVTCAFVWCKTYRHGGPYTGLGFYTRSGTEFCLLGKRGTITRAACDVHQVVHAPVGEHSAKPPEIIGLVERLWPDARRIELFSRSRWPGWDAWGNQVEDAMPLFGESA